MTEESLLKLFAEFECKKVKILKFPLDHTVGYALFDSEEKFSQAFDALNKKKLDEEGKTELLLARPIYLAQAPKKPKKAKSAPKKKAETPAAAAAAPKAVPKKVTSETVTLNDTVLISNLPAVVKDNSALEQIFDGFKILEYRFEDNSAIVKLEGAEKAQEAIEALTGAIVEGMEIKITLYSTNKIRIEKKQKKKNNNTKKAPKKPEILFDFPAMIRNLPYSLTEEEELKKELPQFSFVGVDIKLRSKKHSKGFAIVGFNSEEERAAAEEAKDIVIGGRKIVIAKLVRKNKESEETPKVSPKNPHADEISDFVGVIHNLPFDVTEESQLKEILGDIPYKFAYVRMRGKRSMGYAVVGFDRKEDLDNAIANVSGVNVNGRVINVTLPTHKRSEKK